MTQTDIVKNIEISYQVSMSEPGSHLFEVQLNLDNWQENTLDLKMPVWTPGSYLIREYAKIYKNSSQCWLCVIQS